MRVADAPPPGWYPDPEGGSRLRWWDGTDWSDRYRPRPPEIPGGAGRAGDAGGPSGQAAAGRSCRR